MNILLTGASGRVGRHVCRHLVQAGMNVRACDLVVNRELPVRVEVVNLLDREACYRVLEGVDAVVHLANHPSAYGLDAQRLLNENVGMNMNVFQAAAELGVKKIAFSSTIQVISGRRQYYREGEQPVSELAYLPVDGDHPPNPGNCYGLSKQLSEVMLQYFAKLFGIECIAVRLPGVVESRWLGHMRDHRRRDPSHYGPLDEVFAYLPSDDVAELFRAILVSSLPGYRCYMAAAPSPSIDLPVREIIERFYSNVPLRRPIEEITSLVDVSRITTETGWVPADLGETSQAEG